jgi:hypothetical protein
MDANDLLRQQIIEKTLPASASKEEKVEGSSAASGDLLSQSLKLREDIEKREEADKNKLRENFIKNVNIDLIKGIMR